MRETLLRCVGPRTYYARTFMMLYVRLEGRRFGLNS
jgi:hypothetical protein